MDELTESELTHDIYLNRLSAFYANQFNDIQPEILRAIRSSVSVVDRVETQQDESDINEELALLLLPILIEFEQEQQAAIDELIEEEVNFQSELLAMVGLAVSSATIAQIIEIAKKKYRTQSAVVGSLNESVNVSKKLSNLSGATLNEIKSIVNGAYLNKLSSNDLQQLLTGTRANNYNDGYVAKMKRNLQATIKTARAHAEMVAKRRVFKSANTDGYVLTAVLDSRTSDICLGWHGTRVLWSSSSQPMPPFHYNCRTTMIPFIDGRTEDMQGGFEWLKNQSAEFQNELIGKTRGDLLRNSGLTSEEFRKASRNKLNEPLTLAEMKEKNERIKRRLLEKHTGV